MIATPTPARCGRPRGISLLEVLISIGIMSVGLIAAMSLIPLGRTHLQKAGIDDRAATVIPSAYDSMVTMGLFNEDSLGWEQRHVDDPENGSINDSFNQAQALRISPLGVTMSRGRAVFVEKSSVAVSGRLPGETPDPRIENDPRPARPADIIDWYRLPVSAGETLTVEWIVDETRLNPGVNGQIIPVFFAGRPLNPNDTPAGSASYAVPGDGTAYFSVQRRPDPPLSKHDDVDYEIKVTRMRSDRVIAIDPLMASRLDKVLQLRGEDMTANSVPARRRRYFVDDTRPTADDARRAFRLPRLTWQTLASPTIDESMALADATSRLHDDLEVDDSVENKSTGARDEFAPPRPEYVRDAGGNAWCRKSLGRMSWLLTLQPQAAGSISTNWRAGGVFDASIVVFQDRELPLLDATAQVTGEYTFRAIWSEREGILFVEVPQPLKLVDEEIYLDDEDIRVLFRTGSWLMLAPLVASDAPPTNDREKLVWVRAQTVELEKSPAGVTVRVLPETEPPPDVLLGGNVAGEYPVLAIVHRGVVAVVTKQVTIQGP